MKPATRNKVILILMAVLCILFLLAGCKGTSNAALYPNNAASKSSGMKINPIDGAEMVWVPAGEFIMGSTDEQVAAEVRELDGAPITAFGLDEEKPQRRVYLDGYWMYKNEVTVAQYRRFCKATKREMPKAPEWGWKENHPIVNVSWQDAFDYSKWAEAVLPTEAQWEKAARGTDGRKYPWGNEWDASKCANGVNGKLKSPKPVGSFASDVSPYGCMDMASNVMEWCSDWYVSDYYRTAPAQNPAGPSDQSNVSDARVLRGGSWFQNLDIRFRSAARNKTDPKDRFYLIGFRCARTE